MQLRWYQSEAIDAIYMYFQNGGRGNPVVALQTGLGKSVVIAKFIEYAIKSFSDQRIMMLVDSMELVEQNANKIKECWPNAPVGINCDGLNKRDFHNAIICGSIGSVVGEIEQFGHRDLLIVDECQMVSDNENSMYLTVIAALKKINPALKVIGLSATPFRMKMGMVIDGGIFTDVVYDITDMAGWARMIADGFLCPPVAKRTDTKIDVSKVRLQGGEFNQRQLEEAVDTSEITYKACVEMAEKGYDRWSWLIFATGIKHTEHVCETLNAIGINATFVHSKIKKKERKQRIADFKAGKYRAMVNNGILTKGFDHPPVDLIGVLRPTMSVGLWIQIVGRGTRPYDWWNEYQYINGFNFTKVNCLILDFAGNTRRLGPVNDPRLPKKKGEAKGDAPVKECPKCECFNHASARYCGGVPYPTPAGCGTEFIYEPDSKLSKTASDLEILKNDLPQLEYFDVKKVLYTLHRKENSPDIMKVSYICGVKSYNEFVCLDHSGYAAKRAKEWWTMRTGYKGDEFPTSQQAIEYSPNLPIPSRIKVWVNKKYPEIMNYEF